VQARRDPLHHQSPKAGKAFYSRCPANSSGLYPTQELNPGQQFVGLLCIAVTLVGHRAGGAMTGTAHFPGGFRSLTTRTSRRTRTHIRCFGDSSPAIERETHTVGEDLPRVRAYLPSTAAGGMTNKVRIRGFGPRLTT
jgi:hypothetical protein